MKDRLKNKELQIYKENKLLSVKLSKFLYVQFPEKKMQMEQYHKKMLTFIMNTKMKLNYNKIIFIPIILMRIKTFKKTKC